MTRSRAPRSLARKAVGSQAFGQVSWLCLLRRRPISRLRCRQPSRF